MWYPYHSLYGGVIGWIASEKYFSHITLIRTKVALEQQNALLNRHEFEDLFIEQPPP